MRVMPFIIAFIFTLFFSPAFSGTQVTIGTGGVNGVYYPVGGAICNLVNQDRAPEDVRCLVTSTEGSISNIQQIRKGDLEFGIAQSDVIFDAYNGLNSFENEEPFTDLRAVFSLYKEAFTMVASSKSEITSLDGIKGSRINIGSAGSGQRATVDIFFEALGLNFDDFALISELPTSQQADALCNDEIDVFLFMAGQPNGSILETTEKCDAVIIEIDGPEIDAMIKQHPYYERLTINGGQYKGNPNDVKSFGVRASLITKSKTSDDLVSPLLSKVLINFEQFKNQHKALTPLKIEEMNEETLIPLHSAVELFYKDTFQ